MIIEHNEENEIEEFDIGEDTVKTEIEDEIYVCKEEI